MADKGHLYADRRIDVIERELKALYGRTEAEIEETARRYFGQLERLDKQKKELVESGRLTEEEYKTWRKNKLTYGKRFTEMKEECARQLLNVNRTALEYVNSELAGVYAVNYNQFGKQAMKEVKGYSFTLLSADTVRHLALNDKSLLPYKKLDPSKDVPWNMKKINSEVLQGILQGESTDKIAKRISRVQEMNRTAAVRTARTLVTEAECKGRQDMLNKAAADGIQSFKKWISARDMRVRDVHARLDGQVVASDKPFKSDLGDIMYPGDKSAHPANVYNCRCTLNPSFKEKTRIKDGMMYAEGDNTEEWLEKQREKNPKEFDIQRKMVYNESADRKQYAEYKERLGKYAPRSFDKFRNVKYRDSEQYTDLKAYYQYKRLNTESDKRFYEANKAMQKLSKAGQIKATGTVVKRNRIVVTGKRDHAKAQMLARNIDDKTVQQIIDKSDFALKQQNGGVYSFYSSKGFAAVNLNGELRTVGPLNEGGKILYKEIMKYVNTGSSR